MKNAFFFITTFFLCAPVLCQPSDFMVIKKGEKAVKSFMSGNTISFHTANGSYSGRINAMHRDSVFLLQFAIRQVPTTIGTYILDTVATYRLGFNYREITRIESHKRKGFDLASSGGSLFGGGILITAVGLGTWIFTKPGTQYYASPALVISGAALAGIGYLLLRSNSNKYNIGKKYQLQYVKVK